MSYYEDIDEALAEYDGESDDESLFGRRRRGRRQQRGGYAPAAAPARGAVSQSQWARSMDRVGEDVQDTASAIKKLQADQQNFAQWSMLGPLLLKGAPVEVKGMDDKPVKVAVQSDSILPLVLPMMMMGQSSGTASSPSGGNNMMMMMIMMMVLMPGGLAGTPR